VASKRTYEDGCATAHALDLVGERWALLVVRELILGPKRFTDLRSGLPGISPNVLTQRLAELEESGVVRRRKLPPPAAAWVYELSEWGLELERVIMALGRWAVHSPALMQGHPLSVDALILSFRTMFNSDVAGDFNATLEIRIGEERFRAAIADGEMELTRNTANNPDAIIEGDVSTLGAVAYGGVKFAEAVKSGDLKVTGDKAIAKRFLTLFPLPAAKGN
jgi:DNA-binding HxlR family transcriptional regulator/putative sterol carrier protein